MLVLPLTWVFVNGYGGEWVFLACLVGTFFLASAGASSAYLTVSEIFPMETRALAFGVRAEQTPLEDVAKPVTAEEARTG